MEPLARLREREGPGPKGWEGEGAEMLTALPTYFSDIIIVSEET